MKFIRLLLLISRHTIARTVDTAKKKSDEKQKLQKKKVWRKTKITEKASFAKSEVEMSDAGEKIRGMSWSTKITFLVQNSVLGGISFISG